LSRWFCCKKIGEKKKDKEACRKGIGYMVSPKATEMKCTLTDEQRPGALGTFTFEQYMQIMAAHHQKK